MKRAELLKIQDFTRDKLNKCTQYSRLISFFTILKKIRENCYLKIAIRRKIALMIRKKCEIVFAFSNFMTQLKRT